MDVDNNLINNIHTTKGWNVDIAAQNYNLPRDKIKSEWVKNVVQAIKPVQYFVSCSIL